MILNVLETFFSRLTPIHGLIFKIIGMTLFIICGIIILIFSIRTRHTEIKVAKKSILLNEILIGALFIFNGIIFPILFSRHIVESDFHSIPATTIEAQTYFLCIVGLVLGFIIYSFLILFWWYRNHKKNQLISREEWKKEFFDKITHRRKPSEEFRRKYFPLFIGFSIIIVHITFSMVEFINSKILWSTSYVEVFIQYMILLIALFLTFVKENIRLRNINLLTNELRKKAPKKYVREEFYTFTSRMPLFLSVLPFIYFGNNIFYIIALIGTISDSSASIIGKQFSKFHPDHPPDEKVAEGHIAGFIITFLIIFVVNFSHPFIEMTNNEINIMAFIVALVFMLIDIYRKRLQISDNILNPIFCGLSLVGIQTIFQVI
ncbi:MAG: hypothetical protein ACTSRZ_10485 [Promethearchaeota archaeon]